MRRFLAQLKRRNVFRAGAAWILGSWVVIQVVNNISEPLGLPESLATIAIVVAALGLPVALLLSWLFELTPEGLKRSDAVDPSTSLRADGARKLDRTVIGVLAIAVVLLLVQRESVEPAPGNSSDAAATSDAAAVPERERTAPAAVLANSVAVLPLQNLSPRAEDAYIAAGIHEEILNQLSKIKALNVIARTSVSRYANGGKSAKEIAAELNVQAVLEGSLRYAGDRIRVTTQLIDAATDTHLWSETYERPFADIFAVESDIAINVASALRTELTHEEQARVATVPTRSTEAYAYYLRAQQQLPTMAERIMLLDLALSLDTEFGLAHGLKAALLSNQLFHTVSGAAAVRRDAVERDVRDHIERALVSNPEEFGAHYALGMLDMAAWRWTRAQQSFGRGIETATIPASLYYPLMLHAARGEHDDAMRLATQVRQLDPHSAFGFAVTGIAHGYAGLYAAAATDLRRSVELEPTDPLQQSWLAFVETARNAPQAFDELQRAERLLTIRPAARFRLLPEIAHAYAKLGRHEDARRVFAQIETLDREEDLGTGGWAQAYLAIGDRDKALEQLTLAAGRVRSGVIDPAFINLVDLRANLLADPLLEQRAFAAARAALVPIE